jgi:hypothetical protein
MKKLTIRLTKWLLWKAVAAPVLASPSGANGSSHRHNREEFQKSIQAQFDKHSETAHSQE